LTQHRGHIFNGLVAVLLPFLSVYGIAGCSDTSSVSGPPPPTAPGPLTIATTALPNGTVNQPYATVVAGSGGITPYFWSLAPGSPALPPGLSLDAATGAITGVPTVQGTTSVIFRLQDNSNPIQTVTKTLPITIGTTPQPLSISTSSLPTGYVNQPYPPTTLQATGGTLPFTWSVLPALPNGLVFNLLSPGTISGTPQSGTAGKTNHTFTVIDSTFPVAMSDSQTLSLTISSTVPPVSIMTKSPLPTGQVGHFYNTTLQGSGGILPYTWSVTPTLPAGLTLDASSGAITGTPLPGTAGKINYTFTLQDSKVPTPQTTSKLLSLEIKN